MGLKINGLNSLNFVDNIGSKTASIPPKNASKTPDVFLDRSKKTTPNFLRHRNCFRFEPLLDISSSSEKAMRWWPDELAKLAPECKSKNIIIEAPMADALKTLARESDYLRIDLLDEQNA